MTAEQKTIRDAEFSAALLKAQMAVGAIGLDGTNSYHGYKYATAEAVIEGSRKALHSAGLTIMLLSAELVPVTYTTTVTSKGQSTAFQVAMELRAVYSVVGFGVATRQEVSWPVVPEGGRPFDKAVAAARTACLSYFLRDLLLIPRTDEGTGLDDDSRDKDHEPQPVKPIGPRTEAQVKELGDLLTALGIPDNQQFAKVTALAKPDHPSTQAGAGRAILGLRAELDKKVGKQ